MKIHPPGAELFHEDGRTDKHDGTYGCFSQFCRRAKKTPSINSNKARYWTIRTLFPMVAGVHFSFVAASRPRPADHSHLTYSMVQSPSWEANWFAASQEISRISRNPKVHYRTHMRPPPVPILGQPNPVHIPKSHLLEIRPNIDHTHLQIVKDFWVKYRKYFAHSLLPKTKQALKLRLLFQVALFLQFHRTTSTLLEEVSNWGEPRPTFDAEYLNIDTTEESKNRSVMDDAEDLLSWDPVRNMAQTNSPDELCDYYK